MWHRSIPAVAMTATVGLLLLVPLPESASGGRFLFPAADKAVHVVLFCLLGWAWFSREGVANASRRHLFLLLAALGAYGALLEFVQGWMGFRVAEVADGAANLCGLLLATLPVRKRLFPRG